MRKVRAATVVVGFVALTFLAALPLSYAAVWACGSLLPGSAGLLAAGCVLLRVAGLVLPPWVRWGHQLAGIPHPFDAPHAEPDAAEDGRGM